MGASIWRLQPQPSFVLVLVDRPGYGRSSQPPTNRTWTYKCFAEDVASLADHLGAQTFSVLGHSSGGPNALACAAHLQDRVEACGILAGDPEYAHPDLPETVPDPLSHCGTG